VEMIWIGIGVVVVVGLIGAAVAGSQIGSLQQKFASLGDLPGKSRTEIINAVGPPQSVSALGDGKTLLQWQMINQAGGYHVALMFDENDLCEGVTHESAQ
jgi:hypothetical protein